jgi:RNA polymerase sigma factor (sigma-70 family)
MHTENHLEQQLLSMLAAGERSATEQIYKQHYHVVSNWLLKNGGSASDAADLFQEGMVVLFGRSQNKDFKLTCGIGTYLFEVSKHLWYKKIRKRKREPVYLIENFRRGEDTLEMAYTDEINMHRERELYYEQLKMALDQIGEPCSSLLKAYYFQDKNMHHIARDFGYTNQESAKNQKYKCLGRLRKIFYSAIAN